MSYTVLDGLPLPRQASRDDVSREIVELAARLTCSAIDMYPLWDQLAAAGWVSARSPERDPGLTTEEGRLATRARLDALVAVHLYGLDSEDMEIILADYKALANREQRVFGEFRSHRLVMAEMERELPHLGDARGPTPGGEPPQPRLPAPGSPKPRGRAPEDAAPPDAAGENLWTSPAAGNAASGSWTPEAAIRPRDLVLGQLVRHRSRGEGIVLSVKPTGKGAELLIRFDAGGEAWMVFGLGLLEFAATEPPLNSGAP